MNLNEDLNTSDAWLSEQLFAQLKDLNAEYKDKSAPTDFLLSESLHNCTNGMPLLDDDIPWQDLKSITMDTLETVNFNYDINEVLDLSQAHLKDRQLVTVEAEGNLLDLVENVPLISAPEASNTDEIVPAIIPSLCKIEEEELKILKFLEDQQTVDIKEGKAPTTEILPFSAAYRVVKCLNCDFVLKSDEFHTHVCDKNEDQKILKTEKETMVTSTNSIKEVNALLSEPPCIRLLRENQIRIRRFLKDELKYDVNSSFNLDGTINSSFSNTVLQFTGMSVNSNKKTNGPHECTLCERKFVHASGLLRHMERHALDLIPSNNVTSSNKNTSLQGVQGISGLRVVIKCTLCGRIFFDSNGALNHFFSHFPDSIAEEKEIDNDAEIPYEAYVDDAYNNLKCEAVSLCNSVSNYQENKTAGYLKIVILSCILQCEFCDLLFSEVSYLFVHSACHLPWRRFECFACDICTKTSKEICYHWHAECVFMRENLKAHQATTQRYFVCNVCENKFQSMDLLHEHRYTSYHFFPRLNNITGTLQLPCEYCDSIFETAQECVTHYEEKHYKKCKRDKNGTSVSNKARQYLCDICGKSYTQSSHLWQHLRFHQGVKPFACKEPGCTRKFTIRPDLNDHIRKCHTGERPYHCLVCGKRFLTGSVFYQHRLIHRGERRYECEACGKRFYRADALKNHQRIHTGEKPFGCQFCTKNFRQRGDRDKHIRARHSHLDANGRLMMQMQKLELEAAAAQVGNIQNMATATNHDYMSLGNKNISPPDGYSAEVVCGRNNKFSDMYSIANLELSKNVFDYVMSDIIN